MLGCVQNTVREGSGAPRRGRGAARRGYDGHRNQRSAGGRHWQQNATAKGQYFFLNRPASTGFSYWQGECNGYDQKNTNAIRHREDD